MYLSSISRYLSHGLLSGALIFFPIPSVEESPKDMDLHRDLPAFRPSTTSAVRASGTKNTARGPHSSPDHHPKTFCRVASNRLPRSKSEMVKVFSAPVVTSVAFCS